MDRITAPAIFGLVMAMSAAAPAPASEIEDRLVTYTLRVDPNNETSDIIFRVELNVTPVDHDVTKIAWQITQARFIETDEAGITLRSWSLADPAIETTDGLWWVEHADVDEPCNEDFNEIPTMAGTAEAESELDEDLDYELGEAQLTSQQQALYAGAVAGLMHNFHEVGEEDPVVDPDAEPAEIGGPNEPG